MFHFSDFRRVFIINKSTRYYLANLLISSFLCISPVAATELKPTIHWVKFDFAPFFILAGEDKKTGIADRLFKLLQEAMPQFKHEEYSSNVARILRDFEQDKSRVLCSSLTKNRERELKMTYSKPALLVPNQSLHLLKSDAAKLLGITPLNPSTGISLEDLLKNETDIKLGLNANRSYGPIIDALVKKYPHKTRTLEVNANFHSAYRKMVKRRINATLEAPLVSYYQLKQQGLEQQILTLPIAEYNRNIYAYVVCSNNEETIPVMKAINSIINEQKDSALYRSFVMNWLPNSAASNYIEKYREFLDQ